MVLVSTLQRDGTLGGKPWAKADRAGIVILRRCRRRWVRFGLFFVLEGFHSDYVVHSLLMIFGKFCGNLLQKSRASLNSAVNSKSFLSIISDQITLFK